MKTLILKNNIQNISQEVSTIIRNGGIAILPFDTVYGFVCDSRNDLSLQKIYELKKRPAQKTIGLAVANIEKLKNITDLSDVAKEYITQRTPGKYTFILKKLSWIPDQVGDDKGTISDFCVQSGTIGVRIPDSQLILDVIRASGGMIAQTSANISGQPNCFSINDIRNQYDEKSLAQVDLIVDGGALNNLEASKLVDLTADIPKEIERK